MKEYVSFFDYNNEEAVRVYLDFQASLTDDCKSYCEIDTRAVELDFWQQELFWVSRNPFERYLINPRFKNAVFRKAVGRNIINENMALCMLFMPFGVKRTQTAPTWTVRRV